jgi:outer membrane protein
VKRLWLAALAAAMVAVPARAKDFKLGYVDSDRIITKYEKAGDAKKELDESVRKFEARADSLKADYENAKAEFESQQLTLSEEGRRQKQAEVERLKRTWDGYLTEVYGKGGKIDQRNKELIAPIVAKIDSTVARIADEQDYALVLDAAKTPVVWAQDGLDLTDLVIEELNREYEPVTGGAKKTVYAIMPITNTNDQAQRDMAGSRVREYTYGLFSDQANSEMVASGKVDQQLQDRGINAQQLSKEQALDVARALDVDYVVYGTCSKEDRRTRFELSIVDVRLGNLLKTESGESMRDEELRERVATVVRVLLASVQKP